MFLWPCIMNWPYKTTNVMNWILFIRQILLLSSTCFEHQVLLMYNYVLLKISTWYSKHVEESNNIWRINNIQCITLVVLYGLIHCLLPPPHHTLSRWIQSHISVPLCNAATHHTRTSLHCTQESKRTILYSVLSLPRPAF